MLGGKRLASRRLLAIWHWRQAGPQFAHWGSRAARALGCTGGLQNNARIRAAKAALLDARATSVLAAAQRAVCDPTRAQIVRPLGSGPLDVSDLTQVIGRRRTVISQHLLEAGLVEGTRQGRSIYYRLASKHAVQVALIALEAAASVGR
jgi:ArsR family transcriptional regulator, zinc-responsive transcriptional repressor